MILAPIAVIPPSPKKIPCRMRTSVRMKIAANGEPRTIAASAAPDNMPADSTGDNGNGERHVQGLDGKDPCSKNRNKGDFLLAHLLLCPAEREEDEDECDYPVDQCLRDREKTVRNMHGVITLVLRFLIFVALYG